MGGVGGVRWRVGGGRGGRGGRVVVVVVVCMAPGFVVCVSLWRLCWRVYGVRSGC